MEKKNVSGEQNPEKETFSDMITVIEGIIGIKKIE